MKIGIIIVFHNNEKDFNVNFLAQQIERAQNLEICLVNNCSKDNTYQLLCDIKEICNTNNVSVIDMKKFKSDISAIRVAAKYMLNTLNLSCIGYISAILLNTKYHNLSKLIASVNKNKEQVFSQYIETKENQSANTSLFESLFSVIKYLEQIKESPEII
ncbi:MAG: glycosyltransferase [Algibacter sp.]|uniref:glycosyltransferase n=1 Tax=Algibacter sp. TaxID=1872428 RepID=UPI00261A5E4B|nr:glycosyltransferase [Algibacter sp.]MDG1728333.1 glycosyltransferase [Algibacter sp.]MDG2178386.1 glycosyltransferase [Algibacter sp.]